MRRLLPAILILLAAPAPAAEHLHPEAYYQRAWCAEQGGQVEYRLPDGTRVDCLTATHAVEVDYGPKWAESVGQSLHYSRLTGRRAGVLLILEQPADQRYLQRLQRIAEIHGITIWTIRPEACR